MRALTRTALAGALAAAGFLSSPAAAQNCVGEHSTLFVCVETPTVDTGTTTYCVYAGGGSCEPVDVPTVDQVTLPPPECHGLSVCQAADLGLWCGILSFLQC